MPDRLKLFKMMNPGEFVLFDYNPKKFMIARSHIGGSRSRGSGDEESGGALAAMFHGTNPSKITIREAMITGPETKVMCDNLLNWLAPGGGLMGAVTAALGLTSSKPPLIVCQWGPPSAGFMMTCVMSQVTIDYRRVGSDGIPTLAACNLTLKEAPSVLNMTNPTSGGRPGRNRHTVTTDESLATISQQAFGTPSLWRAIAEVNGIDDPAAIRPGDVLYLPARDEVREQARSAR